MEIREANNRDAALLAMLVSLSNQDVASKFSLDAENCPRHASFCTQDWIQADLGRGVRYFITEIEGKPAGCVGYEKVNPELAYLMRLAVLPVYRRRGIGERLVAHVLQIARIDGMRRVSIGVIGEHIDLIRWYQKLGFKSGETKHFPHLPFSVLYMNFEVEGQG